MCEDEEDYTTIDFRNYEAIDYKIVHANFEKNKQKKSSEAIRNRTTRN